MPGYRGHLFGGIVVYTILLFILTTFWMKGAISTHKLFIWLAACLLGSLFPDIDITSKGQKIFFIALLPAIALSIFYQKWMVLSLLCVSAYIPLIAKHRGITHKAWFSALLPATAIVASKSYKPQMLDDTLILCLFFFIGTISHLILDFGPKQFIKRLF